MKRIIGGTLASLLAFNGIVTDASAADCASQADMAALRIAAMQQELMVAAFSCHDVERYNRFVLAHQSELIDSDARLKSFFVHRDAHRTDASYHTYKTELANASSLRSIRETESFCAAADDEFGLAVERASLSAVVGSRQWTAMASYQVCGGDPALLQAAATLPRPRAELAETDRNHGGDTASPSAARRDIDRVATRERRSEEHSTQVSNQVSAPSPHRELDAAL